MAEELTRSLSILAERGTPRGAESVLESAWRDAMPEPDPRRIPVRGALALVAAAVILILAAALLSSLGASEPSRIVTSSPDGTGVSPTESVPAAADGAEPGADEASVPPATSGAIVISVRDWSGVDGYRLLAVVWSEEDIVGGAFWTLIDSDPFSGVDVVHPPYLGDGWDDDPHPDGWGAGDYLWDQTAWLEPGTYRIDFYANPGELAPYGSHLPAAGAELYCGLQVDVVAGEISTVTIPGIAIWGDPCEEIGSG